MQSNAHVPDDPADVRLHGCGAKADVCAVKGAKSARPNGKSYGDKMFVATRG